MKELKRTGIEAARAAETKKRVILSMGGKGGVGKTSVMAGLAEWFDSNQIPVTLLDLDTENKARGSLTHFFDGRVPKVNIHTPAGLDAFLDHLADGIPVILADMGAGSGQVTYEWFEKMYPDVEKTGVLFRDRRRDFGSGERRECPGLGGASSEPSLIADRREQHYGSR